MSKVEIANEIKEMEKILSTTRNSADRGILADKIKSLKIQYNKADEKKTKKEMMPTKDVAAVADHDNKKDIRGQVVIDEGVANITR